MESNVTVTIEELDARGQPWRILTSHMVRTNVPRSLKEIRAGYNMDRTRVKIDGETVTEPHQR